MGNRSLVERDNIFSDRQQLKELLKKALVFKETTLASGKVSHYYLDARQITLSSEGSLLTARVLLDFLQSYNVQAIGGLTMGADPIVSTVAALSNLEDMSINAFIVRKQSKEHGLKRQIEGPPVKSLRVAIVDDVITSGGSLLQAAKAASENEAEVVVTTALVDRQEGAGELLQKAGFEFKPIFTIKELL